MFKFILTNLFMISFGVVLYLLARSLPRLEDKPGSDKRTVLDRWVASEIPEKLDATMNTFLAKLFRRLRIFLMRVDNFVSETLKRIPTAENGSGKKKIDFKEIHGSKDKEGRAA